jgi:trimeric autotransporter adhesin
MNRIDYTVIAPLVAVLGACSGNSASPPPSPPDAGIGAEGGPVAENSGGGGEAGSGDDGGDPPVPYEAKLTGAQVTPTPVQTVATGTATLALSPDGLTLKYSISFSPADFAPTAVNLHIGEVGENASVTHQLSPISNPMSGQVALSVDEQGAITADGLYIDVPTQAHPTGEIRGQIVLPGSALFVAFPTGRQQVPAVQSGYQAHASFIMGPDQETLIYHVVTDATPTDVRLHRGIGGVNGQVAYDVPLGDGSPLDGTLQIGGGAGNSDPTDLAAGRFYLNVVTQQNPAGELRGQLIGPGQLLFSSTLSGGNEVPPVTSSAAGGSQIIVSADHSSAGYETVVSGIIPIAVELAMARSGQNGPLLLGLTLSPFGAFGTLALSPNDMQSLSIGDVYVNVKTPGYSAGEVRTQLAQQ